jgi:hypothetical protein
MLLLPTVHFFYLIAQRRDTCRKKLKIRWNLAWELLCHNYAKLFNYLKEIISSDSFISQHRKNENNFTRNRKLPFRHLVVFLLNLITGSCQKELDGFFKTLLNLDLPKRIISKAGFSKARLKLKYEAFIELNRRLIEFFYNNIAHATWHGFNLLAADGTLIRLPRIEEIAEHFGAWHPNKGDKCPMARALQLFDPLNGLSIHSVIGPKGRGEREMAADLFLNLMPKDLVLLDRGFPAYWLFNLIIAMSADFCARVPVNRWKIIRKFFHSGKREKIISLPVSPTSINSTLSHYPAPCRA